MKNQEKQSKNGEFQTQKLQSLSQYASIGSAFLDMFFEVGPPMFAKPLIPRYASKQLGFT